MPRWTSPRARSSCCATTECIRSAANGIFRTKTKLSLSPSRGVSVAGWFIGSVWPKIRHAARLASAKWSNRTPPGARAWHLLRAAWREYQRDYARYFAVAMVYYALIALVPLLLLLLAVLGLALRLSDFAAAAALQVLQAVEAGFGASLRVTVEQLFDRLQAGSVIATVVSLIGLLLTASSLFHHLRMMFRAIWKHEAPLASGPMIRAVWATFLEKVLAFTMLLASGALLLLAVVLIGAIHWVAIRAGRVPWLTQPASILLAIVGPLIVAPVTFALIFRYVPPVRVPWRHVWLAAVLCAGAWVVGAEVLALYGVSFGRNLGAYGALGGVLVIMLWMKMIAQALFFGAELCKVSAGRERSDLAP